MGAPDLEYDPREQEILLSVFVRMLAQVTADGGNKRARGEKPPWYVDPTHEVHSLHHHYKWKKGERMDADSGAHPLVHKAWRDLAIAYQETYGKVPPKGFDIKCIERLLDIYG